MATELKSLKIDRVDLVPEGANSAAFVTLYKGKEMNPVTPSEIIEKMKPEHAEVLSAHIADLEKAKAEAEDALAKSNEELAKTQEALAKAEEDAAAAKEEAEEAKKEREGTTSFDDTETLEKSLEGVDPAVREYIERINKQKTAAEEVAKAALAKEKHAEAEAKAEELKALPVEKSKLVEFIEGSEESTVDMLAAIAKGIEGTVLSEVGKSSSGEFENSGDAWNKIEKSAESIAKERGITKEAAVSVVLEEQPELYHDYLKGGAN